MKKQGATLVDPADIETFGKFDDSELMVFMYELKADLNAYLARLGPNAPVKTLEGHHRVQRAQPSERDALLRAGHIREGGGEGTADEKEYVDALAKNHQLARKEGIDALMDKHKLDAIVAPTGGPAWLTDSGERRSRCRRKFERGGGGGISQHQCDGGICLRTCRWEFRSLDGRGASRR